MDHHVKLLDHGYLSYIEHWGSDERIIEAARMSTGKGFLGWDTDFRCRVCNYFFTGDFELNKCPNCECEGALDTIRAGDIKLLSRLWKGDDGVKHSTPFEMAGAVFEVQAPIFVFRQWHRFAL